MKRRKRSKFLFITVVVIGVVLMGTGVFAMVFFHKDKAMVSPEKLLVEYMNHIPRQEYEEMYAMLNVEASGNISQDEFIKRNSAFQRILR